MTGNASPNLHRGMTLIELLVALGLLSILGLGASSWLALTAESQHRFGHRLRFEQTADAALSRIFEDVMVGDFVLEFNDDRDSPQTRGGRGEGEGREGRIEKVKIDDDELIIHTRSLEPETIGKSVTRIYSFDDSTGTLSVRGENTNEEDSDRKLLLNLATCEWRIERKAKQSEDSVSQNEPNASHYLVVTLISTRGMRITRKIEVPG